MPKRVYKSKAKPKRVYKKKAKVATTRIPKGMSPLAERYHGFLKYTDYFAVTGSTGSTGTQQYNLNSIYDPDLTGTGHQPYGRDTLATLYSQYRVMSCSYKFRFAGTSSNIVHCCITAWPTSGSPTTALMAYEIPNSNCRTILFPTDGIQVMKGKIYLPKLNGQTKTEYLAEDSNSAVVGASPTSLNYLSFQMSDIGSSSVTIYGVVELVYEVELWDPIRLSQS